jgi:hypothetical protein
MAKKNIPRTFYVFVRVEIGLRAHPQIPPRLNPVMVDAQIGTTVAFDAIVLRNTRAPIGWRSAPTIRRDDVQSGHPLRPR